MKRSSGILLHISSLPGPGGIGSLGKEAFQFADFLQESGCRVWQVLPMGPTGYGESPYQSSSVFAGNPLLISLETLRQQGLLACTEEELQSVTKEEITNALIAKAGELYQAKEEEYGSDVMRELERVILLKVVDTKWMAHIDDMEELKKGIGLRSYGQKNPVVEYRVEGFDMFDAMNEAIREDTIRMLLTVKLQKNEAPEREQVAKPDEPNAGAGDGSFSEPVRSKKKVGDNDPCPCGSGKKYKKCCKNKDNA